MTAVTGSQLHTHIQQQCNTRSTRATFEEKFAFSCSQHRGIFHKKAPSQYTSIPFSLQPHSSFHLLHSSLSSRPLALSLSSALENRNQEWISSNRESFTWGEQIDKTPIMRLVDQAMEVVGGFVNQKELFLFDRRIHDKNRTKERKKENQGWITQAEVGQYMQRKKWCRDSKEK